MSVLPKTFFGKSIGAKKDMTINDFRKISPINSYEDLSPFIERIAKGEKNVLWTGKLLYFIDFPFMSPYEAIILPSLSRKVMLGCLEIWMDSVSGKFNKDQVTAMLDNNTSQIKITSNHLKALKLFKKLKSLEKVLVN